MGTSLEDAREKIRWAEKHLAGLEAFVQEWHKTDPYEIAIEHNAECWTDWRLLRADPPPTDYALFIGDIANNLRAALDYLVFGLPGHSGGGLIGFPIVTEKRFWRGERSKKLKGIPNDWVGLIHSFQPFKSEEHKPLGLIAAVNNADKHRRLHTTLIGTTTLEMNVRLRPPMAPQRFTVEQRPMTPPKEGEVLFGFRIVLANGIPTNHIAGNTEIAITPGFHLDREPDRARYQGIDFYACIAKVKEIADAFEIGPRYSRPTVLMPGDG